MAAKLQQRNTSRDLKAQIGHLLVAHLELDASFEVARNPHLHAA